ncbi:MAG: hypothetical protein JW881_13925 [Spirochaetales bacterium]|nr:hypothetical protein [Spirochaetales bacterium]
MKVKTCIYIVTGALSICVLAVILFIVSSSRDTRLRFTVIDDVSGGWVWDAMVRIKDRYLVLYYQSDNGPLEQVFTGLEPGEAVLTVSAPAYRSREIPVTLNKGDNGLDGPVRMIGYEIPGLSEIFVRTEIKDGTLFLNPRPIDAEGRGIGEHPCLPMWFGLRISVQVKNGIPVVEPVESGSGRGEELFRGTLEAEWDMHPDTYYRYSLQVPASAIKKHNAPYRVYDYIIVFPIPGKMTKEELDAEMEPVMRLDKLESIKNILDGMGDRVDYFISASWNQTAS